MHYRLQLFISFKLSAREFLTVPFGNTFLLASVQTDRLSCPHFLLTCLYLFSLFFRCLASSLGNAVTNSGCSTPSGIDCGSGRSTPSSVSTVSTICPGDLKVAAKMAPNIPLEMELPGVKIVHAQFNTPMQLYSDDNIMETLQGQVSTALGETPSMR